MESTGHQILGRFKKKRPEVDLSFLDESDEDEAEGAEPSEGAKPIDRGKQVSGSRDTPGSGDAPGSRDGGEQ